MIVNPRRSARGSGRWLGESQGAGGLVEITPAGWALTIGVIIALLALDALEKSKPPVDGHRPPAWAATG